MAGFRRIKHSGRFWFVELNSLNELKQAEEYVANDPNLKREHFETLQSPDREGHYLFCMAVPYRRSFSNKTKRAWEDLKFSFYPHHKNEEG